MKKVFEKGFTLIELLVVVAIIGILSTVVLASLGSARTKAKVAQAKGSLSQVAAQAEIFSAGTVGNNYNGLCADPQIMKLVTTASKNINGTTVVGSAIPTTVLSNGSVPGTIVCNVTSATTKDTYIAAVVLETPTANNPKIFCADVNGVQELTTITGMVQSGSGALKCK